MKDYMNLSSSPTNEDCAQVGTDDYQERSRKECRAFLAQLRRQFGEPPEGADFVIKTFPHDFGSYREVCVVYDDEDEAATEFALKCEWNIPEEWDAQALKELGLEKPARR